MARGRTKALYTPELTGYNPFCVDVPDNLYAEASLGWTACPAGTSRKYEAFKMRRVHGIDATGHRVSVTVADATADLWTGVATTWTFLGNDGTSQTATRTGRTSEAGTD
jgi:hypothetical protein